MRVALLQLRFQGRSRAANLQAVLAGIKEAAEAEPPPDLLVLPGACDAGGVAGAGRASTASRSIFCAALAAEAREWGVFIAAGMGEVAEDGGGPPALLFDPDGDVLAQVTLSASAATNTCPSWATTALGVVGLALPAAWAGQPPAPAGALIAMPIAAALAQRRARTDGRVASALLNDEQGRQDTYWALVAPAGPAAKSGEAQVSGTFLCDPGGAVLAQADTTDEIVVFAEVPLAAADSVDNESDKAPQAG